MDIGPVSETNFGPRAELFEKLCTQTRDEIIKKTFKILSYDRALTPAAFVAKHITQEGQVKLTELDRRTACLFKNLVADVCLELIQKRYAQSFIMLSLSMNDMGTHGRFIQEAALPDVEELVRTIDELDTELLDEAISGGIAPEQVQLLEKFSIRFHDYESNPH